MAPKKKDIEEAEEPKERGSFKSVFKDVDKMNEDGAILSESSLSLVSEWIDTGSLALNAICSGSLYKGVPAGRIIGFYGPSGCGKTFIINQIIGNFQRKDPERWAVVWDSENAEDMTTARSVGADPTKIKHYPVTTIKDTRNQIYQLLNNIIDQGLQGKFIIAIDSLGNLSGDKEKDDAEKGKDASDMGTRAKDIKGMLRLLTMKAAKARTTILFTNHTYDNPGTMYPTLIKDQSGGKGPIFMASILVQLSHKTEKNEEESTDIIGISKNIIGITMHALTTKNRFIPPFLACDTYLNFKTGLNKYAGLFDMGKDMGVITGDNSYECNGINLGRKKSFENDAEIWEKTILPVLEKKLNEELLFSQYNNKDVEKAVGQL